MMVREGGRTFWSGVNDLSPVEVRFRASMANAHIGDNLQDAIVGMAVLVGRHIRASPQAGARPVRATRVGDLYMEDQAKTKDQLIAELNELREQVVDSRSDAEEQGQLLGQVMDSVQEGVIVYGRDLRYRFWNRFMEEVTGVSASRILGQRPQEVFPFLREVGVIDKLDQALAGMVPVPTEYAYSVTETGRSGWASDESTPLRNRDGEIIGVIAIVREITERKQAQEAVRESEAKYRSLFEQAGDCILVLESRPDAPPVIVDANQTALDMHGFTRDEFIGKPISDLDQEATGEQVAQRVKRLMSGEHVVFEMTRTRKDGSSFPVEADVRLLDATGKPPLFVSVERDITERRLAAKAQQTHFERLWAVLDSLDALVYVADPESYELLFINKYGRDVWGDIEGTICWKTLQQGQSGPCGFCTNERLIDSEGQPTGVYRWEFENTVSGRWYDCRDQFMHWTDGRLVRMETATDITERKRSEEKLRENEALTKAILDNLPVGIAVNTVDPAVEFEYTNDNFPKFYRTTREALADPDAFWDAVYEDPKFREEMKERVLGDCASGDPERMHWEDVPITRKGRPTAFVTARNIPVPEKQLMISTVWDVTERRDLEERLRQSRKMESIGQLAGGVAHDFNNMLGIIIGNTEFALENADPAGPLCDDLREVLKAARRSADLTGQLLTFARKQVISPKVLDLNETVEGMLKMLRRLIGENVDLDWQTKAGLWPTIMDPSQIDQILTNLCVNARDAIEDVGAITIRLGNTVLEEACPSGQIQPAPGNYVALSVSDNGCGMDQQTVTKVFEPFFTTKETGKGTGLGLAAVYGIVQQNSGGIDVCSEVGRGTTFTVYLPRHMGAAPTVPDEGAMPALRGTETVLLVEDELAVLKMARKMLERQGYTMLPAPTPTEATRLFSAHADEIHLLIADVIMPEMNGQDLARSLLSLNPSLKCLFMSGYTADIIARHGVLNEGVNFIQKPFSSKELGTKVREVLDENQGG
jgi:PAS domain S-box-containing protein